LNKVFFLLPSSSLEGGKKEERRKKEDESPRSEFRSDSRRRIYAALREGRLITKREKIRANQSLNSPKEN